MTNTFLSLVLFIWTSLCLNAQSLTETIEDRLLQLSDVTFEKLNSTKSGDVIYKLMIKQPLDHSDPNKGYFKQKVYLTHNGFENPTVLVTQGYQISGNRKTEVTQLINANQLNVEHRYFGESIPNPINYKYLNLKQVAADLHHIRMLFDKIYTKQWISTGISKGGSTTIFYRFFYPNDVDVSIPYVAPLTNAFEDQRIYNFLDSIGTKACRDKIKQLQLRLLKNREKVLTILRYYSSKVGWEFTYLSLEEAFELSVLEYSFTFWQWGRSCGDIPDSSDSLLDTVKYFLKIDPLSLFNDEKIAKYGSHYYQAATEMGYYGYDIKNFKNLLMALPNDHNPHATFIPNKIPVKFDGKLLKDVHNWVESEANHFIFIYGEQDTWTACAVPENNRLDAEWFVMNGKHHGNARIRFMTDANYNRICSTLERWLNLTIDKSVLKRK